MALFSRRRKPTPARRDLTERPPVLVEGPDHGPLPAGAEERVVEVPSVVAEMRHWLHGVRPDDFRGAA